MTPMDFLDFRDLLIPASGFQSVQFRLLENKLGLEESSRYAYEGSSYKSYITDEHKKLIEVQKKNSINETEENILNDYMFVKSEKFQNQIALGLDAKDGYLSVSGWKESSDQLTLDYLKEVNDYGVSRLIYTDINRDGMKQSPNFEETSKVSDISNCPVIISGGVSSLEDVKKAKSLINIEGIIVGKAIYDGDIKLEELAKEDA